MSELMITAIHIIATRNVAVLTGELHSGPLAPGDELRCADGTTIPVLAIEFVTPKMSEDSVSIVVPLESAASIQVGETVMTI